MAWAAIGGAAVSVVGGKLMSKMGGGGGSSNSSMNSGTSPVQVADPFASQRQQYQAPLHTLMSDPASAQNGNAEEWMNYLSKDGQAQTDFQAAKNMLAPGYNFADSDPSYQFRLDQGSQNVMRQAGKSGMLGSGNVLAALQDYGQNTASQEFQSEFGRRMSAATAQAGYDSQRFNENQSIDQNSQQLYNNRYSQLAQLSGATSGQPGAAASLQASQQAGTSATLQNLAGKAGGALWDYAKGKLFGDGDSGSGSTGVTGGTDYASQLMPTLADGYSGAGNSSFGSTPIGW